jgi:hypothetical protein
MASLASSTRREETACVPELDPSSETVAKILRLLVETPRWLLLGALVYAPWAYGATRPLTIQILSVLLGLICLLWGIGCVARHCSPRLPLSPRLAATAILAQGWWMAVNAHSSFNEQLWALLPQNPFFTKAPGSFDGPGSIRTMFLFTGLMGVLLFCCDLSRRPIWRKRVWVTIALAGASIAAFGVFQKIVGESALALTWEAGKRDIANTFAMFRYRGNAGAYLNLILPLAAGLAFLGFRRIHQHWEKTFWLVVIFVVIAGIQLNPSRASWCIAIALGLTVIGRIVLHHWRARSEDFQPKLLAIYGALIAMTLLAVAAISFSGGWETSWRRIGQMGIKPGDRRPTEVYLKMAHDAGAMGFGPGTFQAMFPTYQRSYDFGGREMPQFWTHAIWLNAHQDYLQTLIEWGFLGTLFWGLLVVGGIIRGAMHSFKRRIEFSQRWLLFGSVLALAGALIHAWVDFPLQIASIQLYVCVLLGICWGAREHSAS